MAAIAGGRQTSGPIQLERRRPLRLPHDDVLRRTCPRVWAVFDAVFSDKARPITAFIWLEIARRSSYAEHLGRTDPEGAILQVATLRRVQSELAELLSLVTPVPDRDRLANEMLGFLIRESNQDVADARRMVGDWNQRKGRPAERRPLAVLALEMKILNPKLDWSEIGNRLSYPKSSQRPLRETLPAEVRHIKVILRRYGLWDNRRHSSQ